MLQMKKETANLSQYKVGNDAITVLPIWCVREKPEWRIYCGRGGGTFYDLYIFRQFCHLRQLQRILDRILPVSSELTRKIWNKVKSMCPMVTLSIFIDIASCCKQLIPFFTCFLEHYFRHFCRAIKQCMVFV